MENYQPIPVEEYLKLPYVSILSDEIKAEIVKLRAEYEYMTWEQYLMLIEQGVLKRSRKLKKKRSLYVCSDGRVNYFNFWTNKIEYSAYFNQED